MNFFSKAGITGLMFVSTAVFAVEPAEGWYAGFMLGPSYAPNIDRNISISNPFITTTLPGSISYNILGNIGAQLGFRCNKFRYEGELNYNYNTFDKLKLGGFELTTDRNLIGLNMKGHTDVSSALFNAYYEFYDEEYSATKFVPYVGLGIGYAHVSSNLSLYYNGIELNRAERSRSANAPVAQGILGISYFFTDTISLGTDLRYLSTNNIKTFNDSRVSFASWNLVMNFSFDKPAY